MPYGLFKDVGLRMNQVGRLEKCSTRTTFTRLNYKFVISQRVPAFHTFS